MLFDSSLDCPIVTVLIYLAFYLLLTKTFGTKKCQNKILKFFMFICHDAYNVNDVVYAKEKSSFSKCFSCLLLLQQFKKCI